MVETIDAVRFKLDLAELEYKARELEAIRVIRAYDSASKCKGTTMLEAQQLAKKFINASPFKSK